MYFIINNIKITSVVSVFLETWEDIPGCKSVFFNDEIFLFQRVEAATEQVLLPMLVSTLVTKSKKELDDQSWIVFTGICNECTY